MASTKAQSQKEVDQMSKRDRLWDSLSYAYGEKTEQSNKSYDQAMSQADRQLLARGMQRSSYGAQTLANMNQEKIRAANNIYSEQIADYENRLGQIESEEAAAEQWERQFAENQRQFNENMAYQKERANVSDTQWNQQFQYQQGRDAVADQQWQKQFDTSNEQWNKQFNASQDQWNKQFAYQQNRDAVADQQWQKQYDMSLQQWQKQVEQWDKDFEYTKMSTDQQNAYNQVVSIVGNGKDPSDELLKRAGISRADANAMKAQAKSSGGSGKKKDSGDGTGGDGTGGSSSSAFSKLMSGTNGFYYPSEIATTLMGAAARKAYNTSKKKD